MEYRQLPHSDLKVSILGFGASPLGNEFRQVDPAEGEAAVHQAIESGINFFDVSPYYGRTLAEQRLGAALAGKRHQVVISTKCGRYDTNTFDFSAARIVRSCEESLGRLRTDYLDILHAHDIEFAHRDQILNETIPALRALQQQGKVRLIGITGLPLKLLADVAVRGKVDVVMSYCRYNLLIRDLDTHLTPALRQHGIGLLNASPLHMGILTSRGAPAWHPASSEVKAAGARVMEFGESRELDMPAIATRFCLDHPYVSSTFVGLSNAAHVQANVRTLDQTTDPALISEIEGIAGPLGTTWASGLPENQD